MAQKEIKTKNHSLREKGFFNKQRMYFQFFISKIVYMIRFKLIYRYEVIGKENIPKNNKYIVAPNHLSTLDPAVTAAALPNPIAFMAKKELFENPFLEPLINWLGAFAVDREKLSISTIKTVLTISKGNDWVFGIFPQGTREKFGKITKVTKGFASLAKSSKCGVLPMGIVGTEEAKWIPFSGKITVKIGELIPYSDNPDEMVQNWIEQIQKLTGFSYIGDNQD
ncbi:MAG: 1-acyl-sn-glycerol-3-phosphate acyltransferase [bacterium]|nr:1-acyl-sn-glycerol-3-phosphate acyltransferase [bacterium]